MFARLQQITTLSLLAAALFSYYSVASKPLIQAHGGTAVLAYGTGVAYASPNGLVMVNTAVRSDPRDRRNAETFVLWESVRAVSGPRPG